MLYIHMYTYACILASGLLHSLGIHAYVYIRIIPHHGIVPVDRTVSYAHPASATLCIYPTHRELIVV